MAGTIVKIAHPQSTYGLNLSYGSAGTYNGWDRFGRIVEQKWMVNSGTVLEHVPNIGSGLVFCIWAVQSPGMARPLRIEYPGAIYHAVSRGNARQAIFRDVPRALQGGTDRR